MDKVEEKIQIGVVIVNYNSTSYLVKSLHALELQTYSHFEVIVFDNNSSEELGDNLDTFNLKIKLIKSGENLGFSGGNNQAFSHLDPSTSWVALLNPDAYPEKDWLNAMVEVISKHQEYAFWACKLICENDRNLLDGTGDIYHISGRAWRWNHQKNIGYAPNHVIEVFSPCAAAALYRRDILEQVGGFDERFFCYFEDIDLAFRLRLLGYRCGYAPGGIVYHTGSATTVRDSDFYIYHGHRNLVWTYYKNMPLILLIFTLPFHVLLNLTSILLMIKRGQFMMICKAKWDALKGLRHIKKDRIIYQQRKVISTRDLLRVLKKGLPW